MRPVYDAISLVKACDSLNMSYSAMQQNDAAEFLMLLGAHLEEALKGTVQAKLLEEQFGGELLQQIIYEVRPCAAAPRPLCTALCTASAPPLRRPLHPPLHRLWPQVDGVRKVSERKEAFFQIELPVKGHPSIVRAFDTLLEVRTRSAPPLGTLAAPALHPRCPTPHRFSAADPARAPHPAAGRAA